MADIAIFQGMFVDIKSPVRTTKMWVLSGYLRVGMVKCGDFRDGFHEYPSTNGVVLANLSTGLACLLSVEQVGHTRHNLTVTSEAHFLRLGHMGL
jgi:hypothetical protein